MVRSDTWFRKNYSGNALNGQLSESVASLRQIEAVLQRKLSQADVDSQRMLDEHNQAIDAIHAELDSVKQQLTHAQQVCLKHFNYIRL